IYNVESEAETLAATSEETAASGNEVTRAVEEIALGATQQADDTQQVANLTSILNSQFKDLLKNTTNMLNSAKKISNDKDLGLESIDDLKYKTEENNNSIQESSKAIHELKVKSENIGNIIETISSITEQTNLLALNASIEAARAGEHGKGFAVVADEIRKLAEESSKSAEKIDNIIRDIQSETNKTVSIMNTVNQRSKDQNESVQKVFNSFDQISDSVESIGLIIQETGNFIDDMNNNNKKIVSSIENIAAVSEESAASTQQVTASMDNENQAVEEVAKSAENLCHLAEQLNTEISRFKLK
ncbi:MAG: methyl-accepting chemotaxis protein, partial [Bacillota bacterium]|nr:methyl-accepting chemotaxis protein [Bacillota bacterium]